VKVLIVETDLELSQLLETALAELGHEVVAISDAARAGALLEEENAPRLVILGAAKESGESVQLCREIRKRGKQPHVYILLVAARDQKQQVMEGTEAGADDYLLQPFEPYELRVRLRLARRMLQSREEVLRSRETIRFQLHHDPLTGLWNRTAIIDILERELARARRERSRLTLVMAALDGLKDINDAYGHAAGDHILRITARRIRSSLRPYDELGRYDGGMFLIVVPGGQVRSALKQAERLQACIGAQPIEIPQGWKPTEPRDATMSVTISLGVAVGSSEDEAGPLLRAVEDAVERARRAGVNRIEQVATTDPAPDPEAVN